MRANKSEIQIGGSVLCLTDVDHVIFVCLTELLGRGLRIGSDTLVSDFVKWRLGKCSSHSTCFDLPAVRITCLLVEWFVLAGTIIWVADGRLFFADYADLLCET